MTSKFDSDSASVEDLVKKMNEDSDISSSNTQHSKAAEISSVLPENDPFEGFRFKSHQG